MKNGFCQLSSRAICMNLNCYIFAEGPYLPKHIHAHQMVSIGYDLLVIGGFVLNEGYTSKLYKLSCSNQVCKWEHLSKELQLHRGYHVAIALPDDFVDCN